MNGANGRRVDRIRVIVERRGGRTRMRDLHRELGAAEGDPELSAAAIYAAIRNENERMVALGRAPPFRTKREGEAHGWISINGGQGREGGEPAQRIEAEIHRANAAIDETIRERLRKLDWRTFESKFLTLLLEKLGFQEVEVTQATRDGGVDARVAYRRGIVSARALVSAKHWTAAKVPVAEVRNVRGIRGNEDTAIIVTSGSFTGEAKDEAEPAAGQRLVYLIDGTQIVNACKQHGIGVRKRQLPELFEVDERFQMGSESDEEDDDDEPEEEAEATAVTDSAGPVPRSGRRLREEMLGDEERGLSTEEIARLTGHAESTVSQYLYVPERRRSLFQKLRGDAKLCERRRAARAVLHPVTPSDPLGGRLSAHRRRGLPARLAPRGSAPLPGARRERAHLRAAGHGQDRARACGGARLRCAAVRGERERSRRRPGERPGAAHELRRLPAIPRARAGRGAVRRDRGCPSTLEQRPARPPAGFAAEQGVDESRARAESGPGHLGR